MQTKEIIEKIFRYSGSETLQTSSLVSHTWNLCAMTELQSRVTVFIWDENKLRFTPGHAAMETYSGGDRDKGYYISLWPGEICHKKFSHLHSKEDDIAEEGGKADYEIWFYNLDIASINHGFESIKPIDANGELREIEWTYIDRLQNQTLVGFPFINKKGANCSSLIYFLLKKGGVEVVYKDSTQSKRFFYGAVGTVICVCGLLLSSFVLYQLIRRRINRITSYYSDLYTRVFNYSPYYRIEWASLIRAGYFCFKGLDNELDYLLEDLESLLNGLELLVRENTRFKMKAQENYSFQGGLALGWKGADQLYFLEQELKFLKNKNEMPKKEECILKKVLAINERFFLVANKIEENGSDAEKKIISSLLLLSVKCFLDRTRLTNFEIENIPNNNFLFSLGMGIGGFIYSCSKAIFSSLKDKLITELKKSDHVKDFRKVEMSIENYQKTMFSKQPTSDPLLNILFYLGIGGTLVGGFLAYHMTKNFYATLTPKDLLSLSKKVEDVPLQNIEYQSVFTKFVSQYKWRIMGGVTVAGLLAVVGLFAYSEKPPPSEGLLLNLNPP